MTWEVSEEEAYEWWQQVTHNTHFVISIMWEGVIMSNNRVSGTYFATSTGNSCRVSSQSSAPMQLIQKEGIPMPDWLHYEVWFVPGVQCTDRVGLYRAAETMICLGDLGTVFDHAYPNWRSEDLHVGHGEYVYEKMRKVFQRIGIRSWYQQTCGLSWNHYAGVDVYQQYYEIGMPTMAERPSIKTVYVDNLMPSRRRRMGAATEYWLFMPIAIGEGMSSMRWDYSPDVFRARELTEFLARCSVSAGGLMLQNSPFGLARAENVLL